jgi:hypothetical protein
MDGIAPMRAPRARARVRTCEGDRESSIGDHLRMPPFPRCAARLRDGRPCGRTVVEGSEFCVHHEGIVEEQGGEALKRGLPRRKEVVAKWRPSIVKAESEVEEQSTNSAFTADPATVRPRLAEAAAESLDEIRRTLLDAATGATKEQWITFECDCGRKKRVEVPLPDVRARVAAIELLLREGLGRPPQAEEPSRPRLPNDPEAVERMSWQDMQALMAVLGPDLVRDSVAALDDGQKRILRDLLHEVA